MSTQNAGVPLYRVYRGGTPVHLENSGTLVGTATGTPSLKALANNYLSNENAVHSAVQQPVHHEKRCTTQEEGIGTLLEAENRPVYPSQNDTNISQPIFDSAVKRQGRNRTEAYWYDACPDYWRGCASCPDADLYHYDEAGKPVALNSQFCRRHPLPPWAQVTTQGRLLQ